MTVDKNELGNTKLVFYEAKHFENSEIRARKEPKVVEQIRKYQIALSDHKIDIINSYKRVIKNILELNLNTKTKLLKLIEIENSDFEIDIFPKLIIFEVEKNKNNTIHIKKLVDQFADRLILIEKK